MLRGQLPCIRTNEWAGWDRQRVIDLRQNSHNTTYAQRLPRKQTRQALARDGELLCLLTLHDRSLLDTSKNFIAARPLFGLCFRNFKNRSGDIYLLSLNGEGDGRRQMEEFIPYHCWGFRGVWIVSGCIVCWQVMSFWLLKSSNQYGAGGWTVAAGELKLRHQKIMIHIF